MKHATLLLAVAVILFSACKKDQPDPPSDGLPTGMFILNEGVFQSGNSSVSFLRNDSLTVREDVFSEKNARPLGDVLQSMTVIGQHAFLVVNNSGKIEVVDKDDFTSVATLTGFTYPRQICAVSATQAIVTDWNSTAVTVINLNTLTTEKTIELHHLPEQVLSAGGKVFISCPGGFGTDSMVMVLNPSNLAVVDSFTPGPGVFSMCEDANHKIWFLCRGDYGSFSNPNDDIGGRLVRMDPSSYSPEITLSFAASDHPEKICLSPDGNTLYVLNNAVWKFSVTNPVMPSAPLIGRYGYGLAVDPENAHILLADPLDFMQKGWVMRYDLTGTPVDSFRAGFAPSGFVFRR